MSFWFDFGSLLEGFERPCRPKYSIDFESIFDRVSGWGAQRGPTPPPSGVFFRVATPLESRFGRARPESVLESNQKYAISTLIKDES